MLTHTSLSGPAITVRVGKDGDAKDFAVADNLLPEDQPATFQRYLKWLYTGLVFSIGEEWQSHRKHCWDLKEQKTSDNIMRFEASEISVLVVAYSTLR